VREASVIERTPEPRTRQFLAGDLRRLGLAAGMSVLVHSSLSALGWVCGGPVTVVQALLDVVTPDGTIVMPTQSTDYSEPSHWQNPPVPPEWWPVIRATMPAFDPRTTPTRGMGQIVETFRTWPGVQRSCHPIDLDTADFPAIGSALDRDGPVRLGPVGSAASRLFPVRGAVDFAASWFTSRSTSSP
jgi:aminoglycoside 3-N-acetyltransferase